MSLVAYGSSDESSDEERIENVNNGTSDDTFEEPVVQPNTRLCLPTPKYNTDALIVEEDEKTTDKTDHDKTSEKIHFERLPKPKSISSESENVVEDDDIPPKKEINIQPEKPAKKDRAPVKITVPSLSEFKDLEEENERKQNRIMPSKKGTGLFALLPPPKGSEIKSRPILIPHVLNKEHNKVSDKKNHVPTQPITKTAVQETNVNKVTKSTMSRTSLGLSSYDSNSEDEDDTAGNSSSQPTTDFFALTATASISDVPSPELLETNVQLNDTIVHPQRDKAGSSDAGKEEYCSKTLVSNMNLSKEEILLKNKAEVGPKLPVPEQEYNIDTQGNVAFDEKAIEYLCGKRGIKRKNKEIDEANIIEINGEDIKPDEREWLVKALTEEPVVRPVSMQSGGVNSQSKKKHQITYLAHQAKAMEMELKNQWALNRMTRKQTQSKYGF